MRGAGGARTHRLALNSDAATRMIAPGAAAGWMGSGRYGATQAELGQSAASYLKQRKQRALKMMVNSLLGLLRTPATQSRIFFSSRVCGRHAQDCDEKHRERNLLGQRRA